MERNPHDQSQAETIAAMKRQGLSIIEAIKATREIYSIGLGDAKQLVTLHPAWRTEALAAGPLHDAAMRLMEREAQGYGSPDRM